MISHHPSDDSLAHYAAGNLGAGPRLVLATHLSGCPQCRARVRSFEAVGGAPAGSGSGAPGESTASGAVSTPVPASSTASPTIASSPSSSLEEDLKSLSLSFLKNDIDGPGNFTWLST